jgi:hypothetical protein
MRKILTMGIMKSVILASFTLIFQGFPGKSHWQASHLLRVQDAKRFARATPTFPPGMDHVKSYLTAAERQELFRQFKAAMQSKSTSVRNTSRVYEWQLRRLQQQGKKVPNVGGLQTGAEQ